MDLSTLRASPQTGFGNCFFFRRQRRERVPVPLGRDLDDEAGADAGGRRALPHDAVQDRDRARSEEYRAGKNARPEQERHRCDFL